MKKWIIEARTPSGDLDLKSPQPESFFGMGAICGMDENAMAQAIFRQLPDASLQGDSIARWPALINPTWAARPKTW